VLTEAPCSVCFVPLDAPPRLERVLAGIDLDHAGHELLSHAARLCHAARAEELLAVHSCFRETLDDGETSRERFHTARTLDLFRFMARAELNGVTCTPLLEEARAPHRALSRMASEHRADLVLVGRRPGAAARIASELLWDCPAPLVQLLLPKLAVGLRDMLRRVFSNPEPMFN
jgi:hypothetical protein